MKFVLSVKVLVRAWQGRNLIDLFSELVRTKALKEPLQMWMRRLWFLTLPKLVRSFSFDLYYRFNFMARWVHHRRMKRIVRGVSRLLAVDSLRPWLLASSRSHSQVNIRPNVLLYLDHCASFLLTNWKGPQSYCDRHLRHFYSHFHPRSVLARPIAPYMILIPRSQS